MRCACLYSSLLVLTISTLDYFEKAMDTIGEKWNFREFDTFISEVNGYLIPYEPDKAVFTADNAVSRSIDILNSCSQNTRNRFIIKKTNIHSYRTLKSVTRKILQMVSCEKFVYCSRYD